MRRTFQIILPYSILSIAALVFAFPLAWMFLSSLKSADEIVARPHSLLPSDPTWQNYPDALSSMPFLRYLSNSLLLCTGSVIGTLVSCSIVAYGFAKLRWPGRDILFGILIATMLLPWHVTMIPRFLLIRELGLYNSLGALVVPTFLGEAFYIFLLRQFFLSIPEELSEAARIDGLGECGIFSRIVVPLSIPALATVALFQFIHSWNDFNGPLLYLRDAEHFPLAYGLERFISSYSDQTHLLLAASVLFTLPILVLFLLAQRTFVRGIVTTGIKG
ncbi:MAG: carbohydrate ABC transporter permease [Pirellulaceae bacterium]|jgi:multiple sugar transport system permease protein|nr:carbohydrate ABC transporter permease [Pirellulaceae bacterium]